MRYLWIFCLLNIFNCFSQEQKALDVISAKVHLQRVANKQISASVLYHFKIKEDTDAILINGHNMVFKAIWLNQKPVKYNYDNNVLVITSPFKRNKAYNLKIQYTASPKQTVYFTQTAVVQNKKVTPPKKLFLAGYKPQIWTQGQGKHTSHWLPCVDDMNDKIEFDISITTNADQQAIANGKLIAVDTLHDHRIHWQYDMKKPMSSYLAAFVIGDFEQKLIRSSSGVPISLFYEAKDSLKMEPTYRHTKRIFDFLEREIGVPYPWQNYKQVPVQDFLYAGMENTTCTIFSNQYMIDATAFVDKNYSNVNAHELAHQWFGNLVTEKSSAHHWLHEGFATYYAYLAERELFGEDHFYWQLFKTSETLHQQAIDHKGGRLTDPTANSLTFYEKGAWALVALRDRVGDQCFKKGIRNFLNKYAYQNATITDFLGVMEKACHTNLTDFRTQWLAQNSFPFKEAKSILSKNSPSLKTYFKVSASPQTYLKPNAIYKLWDNTTAIPLKQALLKDFSTTLLTKEFLARLAQAPIKVRQAMLLAIDRIPPVFQAHFETYLDDASYITQETALLKLWQAFPEKRHQYLSALDMVVGLPNKNIRQLWLALALVTEGYHPQNKHQYHQELIAYTSTNYNYEIRQLAFQYLYQIGGLNQKTIKSLIKASEHHVWQFKKSSRNLLREINSSAQGKKQLSVLTLSKVEQQQLNKILNP